MNAKQKEILQAQRSLLSRNIVWNPALASSLKAQSLLTDSMIAQIEAAQGAENKVLVMLDLLPLRTSQVYDKFADALHVSGHALLADFLREEDLSKQPLNVKDLFKRLPFLSKNLKDNEKKQIEAYMSEKIQSAILSHTWQWDTREKDKALVAKQEQLQQAHVHELEMRKKQEQVLEAQRQVKEAREETMAVRAELRALTDNASRLQNQMRGQMDTQMRFSMANDSIAQRTSQRLQTAEETLRAVQDKLTAVVRLSPRDQERDQMRLAENPFAFLPEDVDVFLQQFKKLLVVQLRYEDLLVEKNYILTHLGLPEEKADEDQEPGTLLKAFQDHVSSNEAVVEALRQEAARCGGLLEEMSTSRREEERKLAAAGTVWQNAIMAVMRKQLQDLKAALRKKDSTLGIKDAEVSKLRSKVSELEAALTAKTREAELASRAALAASDLHNGHSDSLDPPTSSASPHTHTTTTGSTSHGLPPLKSAVSHKTCPSPRPALQQRVSRAVVPRGLVMHTDTPPTMYPAGLTTLQLRVDPQPRPVVGAGAGAGPPSSSSTTNPADLRGSSSGVGVGRPPMGSTLGDLRAMHSRYPGLSRGAPGAGGSGLDGGSAPLPSGKTIHTSSPAAARRKIAIKVK
ncbi:uncharacterized protein LOC143288832 [Babylonia areolata]|uniref:uncharacterized protein LOC143288832 n=1 Tax=Babylonia areolata TaxID=304850 RepID=UPI003FD4CDD9